MDVSFVNPFIEGTLYILDTTAALKVKPDPPFVKKGDEALGDISGVLKMEGDISGSAAVSFSGTSILYIVSAMFGEEMTEVNEEIYDAVGEICNMIAGHVTTKMTEMEKSVKVKLVKVHLDQGHAIAHADGVEDVIVLPFRTTMGKLMIEVGIAA
ncbi:MAG: chemotaxis protein CheX [Desulfarculaceae bacterium]|nr:chemotaxis protein CheX [Desulfarculaceae bacterium]